MGSNRDDGWRIPDELWEQMRQFLPARKRHPLGCHNPRVPDRTAMDAIFIVLRTGCKWRALDGTGLCSHSSAHRRYQEWLRAGVFAKMKTHGLLACKELQGLDFGTVRLGQGAKEAKAGKLRTKS